MKRAHTADTPAFRKMRLVPIADNDGMAPQDKLIQEERVRQYNPLVSTMADLLPQLDKVKVKRGNYTAALALQNANMQKYKSLERQLRDGPSGQLPTPTALAAEPVHGVTPIPDVEVPFMYRPKLGRLLDQLGKHPGAIGRTDADELVLDGVPQRGTTFTGAMRSLYVNSSKPAPGTRQLVARLRDLRIPKNLLSSKFAQSVYGQAGSGLKLKWPGKPAGRILHVYK